MTPRVTVAADRRVDPANLNGSVTSTLTFQGGTVGNQNFVLPDQGAAGTYNILTAASLSNAWNLTGTNTGTFSNTSGTFSFTGFQNLNGGTLDDTFTLNAGGYWTVVMRALRGATYRFQYFPAGAPPAFSITIPAPRR